MKEETRKVGSLAFIREMLKKPQPIITAIAAGLIVTLVLREKIVDETWSILLIMLLIWIASGVITWLVEVGKYVWNQIVDGS